MKEYDIDELMEMQMQDLYLGGNIQAMQQANDEKLQKQEKARKKAIEKQEQEREEKKKRLQEQEIQPKKAKNKENQKEQENQIEKTKSTPQEKRKSLQNAISNTRKNITIKQALDTKDKIKALDENKNTMNKRHEQELRELEKQRPQIIKFEKTKQEESPNLDLEKTKEQEDFEKRLDELRKKTTKRKGSHRKKI